MQSKYCEQINTWYEYVYRYPGESYLVPTISYVKKTWVPGSRYKNNSDYRQFSSTLNRAGRCGHFARYQVRVPGTRNWPSLVVRWCAQTTRSQPIEKSVDFEIINLTVVLFAFMIVCGIF
jgi:hypothetical protein